jgi:hypothetical protein
MVLPLPREYGGLEVRFDSPVGGVFIELRTGVGPDHVAEVSRKEAGFKVMMARYDFQEL